MTICFFAVFAVAIVAEGGQFVVRAFQVTAGNVVEKQIGFAIGMTATKEAVLDRLLVFVQPVEIGIQVIFIEGIQAQHVTGGMAGGQTDGRQS